MTLERPQNFKPSTKAMESVTRRDSLFVNIPQGSSARVRFLPPVSETGQILYKTVQHFKLKDDGDNNIAAACLQEHGTTETGTRCLVCAFHAFATSKYVDGGEEDYKRFVRFNPNTKKGVSRDHVDASLNYHAQVLVNHGDEYSGPHILRMTQSMTDRLRELNGELDLTEETYYTDIEGGYDLVIHSLKTQPWAKVQRTKPNGGLDQIFPGWDEKFMRDLMVTMKLRVYTREEQVEILKFSLPDAIFAEFKEHAGL